ncbi:aspartate/glutamate racemase family protein [Nocardioides bigeumensis]|uniref:Aspartate/glutamate racemase family protein n=1 Tax=Nocardioides bigeumensis TaxID=433657 RepID=A0ABP5J9F4_9ACTN
MKRIGLLGGMSWESSDLYYELINELVRERLGGVHSADCVMISVDFDDIEKLQAAGEWDAAGERLAFEAQRLVAAGAELMVLCTNTMHKVADAIQAAVDVPLLHLGDVTAKAAQEAGCRELGLLGTGFTMAQDFYRDRIASHGLTVLVPDDDQQAMVHRVIYDQLVRGIVREESRAAYAAVIDELVSRGCDGIILGCTEIELLVGQDDSPVPVLPTTRLHAIAAVDAALA